MATEDYDFTLTRTEIVEQAYRKIGILSDGQQLTGEQTAQGVMALNMLVKQWQTKDIFLWQIVEQSDTVADGTSSIATDNAVLGIDRAWFKDGTNDIPITLVSYREYVDIINKETASDTPYIAALGHEKGTPTLYIWPEASGNLTVYYLAILRLQDMDTASGNADIPQRFEMALVYGLATILADDYGLTINERKYLRQQYELYFIEAQKSDYEFEDHTFSAPCFID